MSKFQPIALSESAAARLLDMPLCEFRRLVKEEHLPEGKEIAPGIIRWSREVLEKIVNGDAARPKQEFEL